MGEKYEVPKVTNIFDVEYNDSAQCVGCMIATGSKEISNIVPFQQHLE